MEYFHIALSAVWSLIKTEISKKIHFHKILLQQIMHLPDRTADVAIYILSGQIPIEGEIHKRTLGTLRGGHIKE